MVVHIPGLRASVRLAWYFLHRLAMYVSIVTPI